MRKIEKKRKSGANMGNNEREHLKREQERKAENEWIKCGEAMEGEIKE